MGAQEYPRESGVPKKEAQKEASHPVFDDLLWIVLA